MKLKLLALSLFLLLASRDLSAQQDTAWIVNTIDSVIKVTLPGKVEMKEEMKHFYMGWAKKGDAVYIVQKIDVFHDEPGDSNLTERYDGITKTFVMQTQATVIEQKDIKNGAYTGRYLQGKMIFDGVLCFFESQMYLLNGDTYSMQLAYKAEYELKYKELSKDFLKLIHITPGTSQP